ncbi:MAG TPA: CrcB family protein [Limnochordales bacterium]
MEYRLNELGQPIGLPVPGWKPPSPPGRVVHVGRYCRTEPLAAEQHGRQLYAAFALDTDGRDWTYLPYGPFPSESAFLDWVKSAESSKDSLFFAIVDQATGRAVGIASYLRITPAAGSIEVGHIHYSPLLQRRPAATEAMYLMMKHGAIGALSRFAVATWIRHYWASPFPIATFGINVAGSLALGYVLTVLPTKPAGSIWVALTATGFLGSFTTFSTFSWETVALVRSGSVGLTLLYVGLSLVTSFVGVFVGLSLGSRTLE